MLPAVSNDHARSTSLQPAMKRSGSAARTTSASGASHAPARTEYGLIGTLALAAVALALTLAHPNIIGHDDGLYAALGRALAERGEYRLIDLPSQPLETKYPPLYPVLLAPVWLVAPSAPANIPYLKAVNALLLGVAAVLFWYLVRRVPGLTAVQRVIGTAVLVSSPGVFSFTDLLTSEIAFLVVLLALLLGVPRDTAGASPTRLVSLGVIAGAAVLTRTAGIGIAAGVLLYLLRSAGAKRAAIALATVIGVTAPWFVWRAVAMKVDAGPLESYYLAYESSAWQRIPSDPSLAWRIMTANAAFYLESMPIGFGLYASPVAALAGLVAAAGLWRMPRGDRTLLAAVVVCYAILVVGHPVPMERYLVPLVPLAVLLLIAGTGVIGARGGGRSTLTELVAVTPLVLLLAGNVAWLRHCSQTKPQGPQWHFGRRVAFPWGGFEEVFGWIRRNAPEDAVLATAYDPVYFLHTGRRAIRPWRHEPERYRTDYGWRGDDASIASVGDELDLLGVTFLVIDPLGMDGESAHARRTIQRLLAGSSSGEWIKVFETSNGQHGVYQRSR
jgi:hypothetical protein